MGKEQVIITSGSYKRQKGTLIKLSTTNEAKIQLEVEDVLTVPMNIIEIFGKEATIKTGIFNGFTGRLVNINNNTGLASISNLKGDYVLRVFNKIVIGEHEFTVKSIQKINEDLNVFMIKEDYIIHKSEISIEGNTATIRQGEFENSVGTIKGIDGDRVHLKDIRVNFVLSIGNVIPFFYNNVRIMKFSSSKYIIKLDMDNSNILLFDSDFRILGDTLNMDVDMNDGDTGDNVNMFINGTQETDNIDEEDIDNIIIDEAEGEGEGEVEEAEDNFISTFKDVERTNNEELSSDDKDLLKIFNDIETPFMSNADDTILFKYVGVYNRMSKFLDEYEMWRLSVDADTNEYGFDKDTLCSAIVYFVKNISSNKFTPKKNKKDLKNLGRQYLGMLELDSRGNLDFNTVGTIDKSRLVELYKPGVNVPAKQVEMYRPQDVVVKREKTNTGKTSVIFTEKFTSVEFPLLDTLEKVIDMNTLTVIENLLIHGASKTSIYMYIEDVIGLKKNSVDKYLDAILDKYCKKDINEQSIVDIFEKVAIVIKDNLTIRPVTDRRMKLDVLYSLVVEKSDVIIDRASFNNLIDYMFVLSDEDGNKGNTHLKNLSMLTNFEKNIMKNEEIFRQYEGKFDKDILDFFRYMLKKSTNSLKKVSLVELYSLYNNTTISEKKFNTIVANVFELTEDNMYLKNYALQTKYDKDIVNEHYELKQKLVVLRNKIQKNQNNSSLFFSDNEREKIQSILTENFVEEKNNLEHINVFSKVFMRNDFRMSNMRLKLLFKCFNLKLAGKEVVGIRYKTPELSITDIQKNKEVKNLIDDIYEKYIPLFPSTSIPDVNEFYTVAFMAQFFIAQDIFRLLNINEVKALEKIIEFYIPLENLSMRDLVQTMNTRLKGVTEKEKINKEIQQLEMAVNSTDVVINVDFFEQLRKLYETFSTVKQKEQFDSFTKDRIFYIAPILKNLGNLKIDIVNDIIEATNTVKMNENTNKMSVIEESRNITDVTRETQGGFKSFGQTTKEVAFNDYFHNMSKNYKIPSKIVENFSKFLEQKTYVAFINQITYDKEKPEEFNTLSGLQSVRSITQDDLDYLETYDVKYVTYVSDMLLESYKEYVNKDLSYSMEEKITMFNYTSAILYNFYKGIKINISPLRAEDIFVKYFHITRDCADFKLSNFLRYVSNKMFGVTYENIRVMFVRMFVVNSSNDRNQELEQDWENLLNKQLEENGFPNWNKVSANLVKKNYISMFNFLKEILSFNITPNEISELLVTEDKIMYFKNKGMAINLEKEFGINNEFIIKFYNYAKELLPVLKGEIEFNWSDTIKMTYDEETKLYILASFSYPEEIKFKTKTGTKEMKNVKMTERVLFDAFTNMERTETDYRKIYITSPDRQFIDDQYMLYNVIDKILRDTKVIDYEGKNDAKYIEAIRVMIKLVDKQVLTDDIVDILQKYVYYIPGYILGVRETIDGEWEVYRPRVNIEDNRIIFGSYSTQSAAISKVRDILKNRKDDRFINLDKEAVDTLTEKFFYVPWVEKIDTPEEFKKELWFRDRAPYILGIRIENGLFTVYEPYSSSYDMKNFVKVVGEYTDKQSAENRIDELFSEKRIEKYRYFEPAEAYFKKINMPYNDKDLWIQEYQEGNNDELEQIIKRTNEMNKKIGGNKDFLTNLGKETVVETLEGADFEYSISEQGVTVKVGKTLWKAKSYKKGEVVMYDGNVYLAISNATTRSIPGKHKPWKKVEEDVQTVDDLVYFVDKYLSQRKKMNVTGNMVSITDKTFIILVEFKNTQSMEYMLSKLV
jgi:hypothetical protein